MNRRSLLTGLAGVAAAGVLSACDSSAGADPTTAGKQASTRSSSSPSTPAATATKQLPRGGTRIFPEFRLFGYSGAPNAPGQGQLGLGDLDTQVLEMEQRGAKFAGDRKVLPVMELIVTTAQPRPGRDGMYRSWIDDTYIDQWLEEARLRKALLLLNIQPGRADFLPEVQRYEKYLTEPDVGVALDPEWAVDPGQVPGRVFGHTSGAELNSCAEYLAGLVRERDLPEKVMVYHQLNAHVVRNESQLQDHQGIVMVKSIDGIGSPGAKTATWKRVIKTLPKHVHPGFKLFFSEDVDTGGRLMTPTEVLALSPTPEYVLYE